MPSSSESEGLPCLGKQHVVDKLFRERQLWIEVGVKHSPATRLLLFRETIWFAFATVRNATLPRPLASCLESALEAASENPEVNNLNSHEGQLERLCFDAARTVCSAAVCRQVSSTSPSYAIAR